MDKISGEQRSDFSLVSLFSQGFAPLHQHIYIVMCQCYTKLNKITSVTSRNLKEGKPQKCWTEEGWFYSHINKCSFCWRFDASHSHNDLDDENRNSMENSWAQKSKGKEVVKK